MSNNTKSIFQQLSGNCACLPKDRKEFKTILSCKALLSKYYREYKIDRMFIIRILHILIYNLKNKFKNYKLQAVDNTQKFTIRICKETA